MHRRKGRVAPVTGLVVLSLAACGDSMEKQLSDTHHTHEHDAGHAAGDAGDAPGVDAGNHLEPSAPDAGDGAAADAGAPDAAAEDAGGHTELPERLLVADALAPVVRIVDAERRETLASFGLDVPARVYRGALGRYGYAVQGSAGSVRIIDSGLVSEDHGDHVHQERYAPGLLSIALEGQRPVHFVGHGSQVAAFFDDEGVAHVLDERSLDAAEPTVVKLDTGLAHHGVAVTFGSGFLASIPELIPPADRAAPTGIAVYDASGTATGQRFTGCPALHGEAALDDVAAFGCSDGVLVVAGGTTSSARKLPNPPSARVPAPRVGTLIAHPALTHMVGNFGPDHLCTIDLATDTITPVPVPAPYLQFAFDAHAERVLLLARSGHLHILDAADLSPRDELSVTTAPTDDSGHGALYPQFAVGTRHVYVTDPQRGKVVVVDVESASIAHEIAVEGRPTKIAVLGPVDVH